MIRKIISIVLLIMLMLNTYVFAIEITSNNDIFVNGEFIFDKDIAEKIAQKEAVAKEYYNAKINGDSSKLQSSYKNLKSFYTTKSNLKNASNSTFSTSSRLNISQVPQQRDYWCGYAAIKSLLDYEGIVKTQTKIAQEVYNVDDACPWYTTNGLAFSNFPAAVYLENTIGVYYVPYPYGAAGSVNVTAYDVNWRVVATIDAGHGLISCGHSRGDSAGHSSILPGYPSYFVGHWIGIDGYEYNGDKIWIVDPAKSPVIPFANDIQAYYPISSTKLASYCQPRGLIW